MKFKQFSGMIKMYLFPVIINILYTPSKKLISFEYALNIESSISFKEFDHYFIKKMYFSVILK